MLIAVKNQLWSVIFEKTNKRDKIFKNGPSKICGKQPLKNLKGYGVLNSCLPQILLVHS